MSAKQNKLPCSFLWTLEIGDGIKVSRPAKSDPASPGVLAVTHKKNLPIAVAISEDAHVAALIAVDPKELPAPDFREWVLRLAPGVTISSVDVKAHVIQLHANIGHSIVVFKMPNPADMAFIVTPNPTDVSKKVLSASPQVPIPTGT